MGITSRPLRITPTGMLTHLMIHERQARWARQVRPRVSGWPVAVTETRSGQELASAASRSACPLVVIDPRGRAVEALEDLAIALRAAPGLLSMIFLTDPASDEFASLAREAGATMLLDETSPPPAVVRVLERWVRLARQRSSRTGWAEDRAPVPQPWESLLGLAPGAWIESRPA